MTDSGCKCCYLWLIKIDFLFHATKLHPNSAHPYFLQPCIFFTSKYGGISPNLYGIWK